MGTDQYHEPAQELSQKMRTFARMITALVEEAEAIGWYEQRISLCNRPPRGSGEVFGGLGLIRHHRGRVLEAFSVGSLV
jgi:hypothetical protein